MHTLAAPTLAAALWPARGARTDIFRAAILAFAGSVFLAISAKFQIPFWPVPFTLQTFVVSILGMVYGRKLAVAAVLLYLAKARWGCRCSRAAAAWRISPAPRRAICSRFCRRRFCWAGSPSAVGGAVSSPLSRR